MFVTASTAILLVTALAGPAAAGSERKQRWVDDDGRVGSGSCSGSRVASKSIQRAIDASDRNDEVVVCPGTYSGTIRITGNRQGLTVRGLGDWSSVLKAPKPSSSTSHLVVVSGVADVTIKNLRLSLPTTGDCGRWAGAIRGLRAPRLRVLANRIAAVGPRTLGRCGYRGAVSVSDSSAIQVIGNVISDFRTTGIGLDGSPSTIADNSVRFLHANYEGKQGSVGIRAKGAPTTLRGNEVRTRGTSWGGHPFLRTGITVSGDAASGSIVERNRVSGATFPLEIVTTDSRIEANVVKRNKVGAHLHGTANDVMGNDFRGNQVDDCWDWTTGDGTAGTGNTWTGNKGNAQSPEGICERDAA